MAEARTIDLPVGAMRGMLLNFGPQHPATHGTLRVKMELEGESITKTTPYIGFLHSGFEKLGEHLDFNQYVTVVDRMNYMSALCNDVAWHLAVEKLFGVEVPKRCQYIRVLLAELSRIADHLIFLGTHALDLGAFTAFLWAFREREKFYDIVEMITGGRMTTSFTRAGGLWADMPKGFEEKVMAFCEEFPERLAEIEGLLTRNRIWIDRTKDIGVISGDDAISFGLTGPCLRASGIVWDIRRAEPYSSYEDFDFEVPYGEKGDVYDRYLVRLEEMRQSVRIVEQAVNNMPSGPVDVDQSTKIRMPPKQKVYTEMESLIHHFELIMPGKGPMLPEGEVYVPTESPNGELGYYIVADGKSKKAYRARTRPPSFVNYQAFSKMVEGGLVADAVAVLGSLNIIAAELDR
jgi:NADH-quinone oxidoreductase subunit D